MMVVVVRCVCEWCWLVVVWSKNKAKAVQQVGGRCIVGGWQVGGCVGGGGDAQVTGICGCQHCNVGCGISSDKIELL